MMFDRVRYEKLNSRQQENYNFAKVSAWLADYGFNCLRLSDDWQGADFIACHINNETFLKVQLKGRLAVDKKYGGKEIFIAFLHADRCYVYPHDEFLNYLVSQAKVKGTESWESRGTYSWPNPPPKWALEWLADFEI